MSIQQMIQNLASQFAATVVDRIRSMPLDELLAVAPKAPPGPGPKTSREVRHRRTAADIEKTAANIASLLAKNPKGLRAEDIRRALQLEAKELPKPIALAIANGTITKTGQKRATTYRLVTAKTTAKKSAKKRAKAKPAKKKKPAKKAAAKNLNGAATHP
jgi:hypothetical protein